MTILHRSQAFMKISQRKRHYNMCVKAAICIPMFIQLTPELIACLWPIVTDF